MTSERHGEFGFAAAHDAPIPYLQRIRDYYQGLGYGAPYEWAHYADVPFRPLGKPLSRSRVTIITTAAPHSGRARMSAANVIACRSFPVSASRMGRILVLIHEASRLPVTAPPPKNPVSVPAVAAVAPYR